MSVVNLIFETGTWSIKIVDEYGNVVNDLTGPQPTMEAAFAEAAVRVGKVTLQVYIGAGL